ARTDAPPGTNVPGERRPPPHARHRRRAAAAERGTGGGSCAADPGRATPNAAVGGRGRLRRDFGRARRAALPRDIARTSSDTFPDSTAGEDKFRVFCVIARRPAVSFRRTWSRRPDFSLVSATRFGWRPRGAGHAGSAGSSFLVAGQPLHRF